MNNSMIQSFHNFCMKPDNQAMAAEYLNKYRKLKLFPDVGYVSSYILGDKPLSNLLVIFGRDSTGTLQ